VWKSTLDDDGLPGEFAGQPELLHPVTDATMALEGTFLWVFGGSDASGPTAVVQRGSYGNATTAGGGEGHAAAPTPATEASEGVNQWATSDGANLPAPRTGAAGFAANGALYVAGGSDGSAATRELYWAMPDSEGNLPGGWRHLDATDLPEPVADAAPVTSGSSVFLIGGEDSGARTTSVRAGLAPEEPFFQLGLVGVVVPGLQIGGEIGQQLGYLAAAGVGTGNFVLLVAVGWAFNHKPMLRGWWERRKLAREAKAPAS
jgi:hypothetical protein